VLAAARDLAQLVQLGREAGLDHAPLVEGRGRVVVDGALEQVVDVGQRIEPFDGVSEHGALELRGELKERRELAQRGAQRQQVPRPGDAGRDLG